MGEITKISDALTETIKDGELRVVSLEIAESVADNFLDDGLLKDVPVLGTIHGIYKTAMNVRDKMFVKKLIYFLTNLKDVPKEKRYGQIQKIENSKGYRTKVGEKLLNIIERCDDNEKAEMIGKIFKAFLEERIDYDTFLRIATAIDLCVLQDLKYFIEANFNIIDVEQGTDFLSSGLVSLDATHPKIKRGPGFVIDHDRDEVYEDDKYKIEGGELICRITYIGKLIRKLLV